MSVLTQQVKLPSSQEPILKHWRGPGCRDGKTPLASLLTSLAVKWKLLVWEQLQLLSVVGRWHCWTGFAVLQHHRNSLLVTQSRVGRLWGEGRVERLPGHGTCWHHDRAWERSSIPAEYCCIPVVLNESPKRLTLLL